MISTLVLSDFDFNFNFNSRYYLLTLTPNLEFKLKLDPKYDFFNDEYTPLTAIGDDRILPVLFFHFNHNYLDLATVKHVDLSVLLACRTFK